MRVGCQEEGNNARDLGCRNRRARFEIVLALWMQGEHMNGRRGNRRVADLALITADAYDSGNAGRKRVGLRGRRADENHAALQAHFDQ